MIGAEPPKARSPIGRGEPGRIVPDLGQQPGGQDRSEPGRGL